MIVIRRGSGFVSTSTKHILSRGIGSSFQCRVIQIVKTWDMSFFASEKFPDPRESYVSMSHVRTNARSWVKREDE